ncbi:MAG: MFS transporter [Acidobacteriota bacterium]
MTIVAEEETSPATETPPVGTMRRMFSALHYRDFRLLWGGAFVSTTGTWMQTVAQSWVVLSMTGSALLLGFDAFLATLPMIFFSLLGGVAADRFDRRKMLLASQYSQMTFAFVLAALIYFHKVEVWHIFVLSFLTGTAQSFGGPSYQALLPILVKREDVPNAVAMNSIQFNLARVIGPVLAGLTLAAWGAAACFGLNGLSFVAVIISLWIIRSPFMPDRRERRTVSAEMKEGFGFMTRNPSMIELSGFAFVTTFFGIPLVTLLPVVARSTLHVGAKGYSWILAAYGVGSVAGALFVAAYGHSQRKGRVAIFFLFLFSLFLLGFAVSKVLWLSLILIFFAGIALIAVVSMVMSLVQLAVSDSMRGRVMSIFMLAFRGGMPLGNLASGFVAERFGVTAALSVNAVCLGIFGLSFLIRNSVIKTL